MFRSDIVVADDLFAEIAARTWIDEYAKLDRRKLLETSLSYDKWLQESGSKVYEAIYKFQGPFLPNTFTGPLNTMGKSRSIRSN